MNIVAGRCGLGSAAEEGWWSGLGGAVPRRLRARWRELD